MQIAVEKGSVLAAYLDAKGAEVLRADSLHAGYPAVAAAEWELQALGYRPTEVELLKENHVMAVPPGENDWLLYVDRFLSARKASVSAMLRKEVAP